MSVAEAARRLAAVVERIRRRRESTLLLNRGEPVARIVPVSFPAKTGSDLARIWKDLPHLSREEADCFDADLAAARRHLPPVDSKWE